MIEKPSTEKLERLAHELKLEGRTEESEELFQWLSYIDWLWNEMQGMSERLILAYTEVEKLKKLISELKSKIEYLESERDSTDSIYDML